MSGPEDLKKFLEEILLIEIDNLEVYESAFTHSSYNANNNYQRLEFLGDAVLNQIISEYLFKKYPHEKEGFLTKERATYVRKEVLGMIAHELKLKELLKLGRGEELDGGRDKISILSDLFEAFIGALYLDKGFLYTKDWVLINIYIFEKFRNFVEDYKSLLQEKLQKKGLLPTYLLAKEEGESHKKIYTVEIFIDGEFVSKGDGKNKKLAEQMAACEALKKMFPDEKV